MLCCHQLWIFSILFAVASALPSSRPEYHTAPCVNVINGTYAGLHAAQFKQDFFLGIPFAQSPTGDRRFRNPKSLNSTWHGRRLATSYSPECVGYGPSQIGYNVNEDCLYLNVIRPSGSQHEKLPVLVWIFGGGFVQGGAPDLRYNLSFLVEHSVEIGHPIIAVSLNYRLSGWGFLSSDETARSGDSNFGIRDQRLALHWIQENIAAFGGDNSMVSIGGQSAGAMSVGLHLTAYNGRDDGLFRAAIMDSGGPLFSSAQSRSLQPQYDNITQQTGCAASADTLQCLRSLPFEQLNSVINTTGLSGAFGPRIDNDLIYTHSSTQLSRKRLVHVPIVIGTNSDEGTSFSPRQINTTDDFKDALIASRIPPEFTEQLSLAYPDDPRFEVLQNLPPEYRPGPPFGAHYRQAVTYFGDSTFIAGRRLTTETWASAGVPAYSYRFNAIPSGYTQEQGATHFVEVAFAMLSLDGIGYPPVRLPPFQGKPESYRDLARLMCGDFVSFTATTDPNSWRSKTAIYGAPAWPPYDLGDQINFVYDANVTSYLEADTWRAEGISLINAHNLDVYDR